MKEPTKTEIAKAVIALLELESHYKNGWKITPKLGDTIRACIDDLRFYYQFAQND